MMIISYSLFEGGLPEKAPYYLFKITVIAAFGSAMNSCPAKGNIEGNMQPSKTGGRRLMRRNFREFFPCSRPALHLFVPQENFYILECLVMLNCVFLQFTEDSQETYLIIKIKSDYEIRQSFSPRGNSIQESARFLGRSVMCHSWCCLAAADVHQCP